MNKIKLTNRQAQAIYHCVDDTQFDCEGSAIFNEMQKIIAEDPFKNEKFTPIVNGDVIGFWLHNEISDLIDFYESEMASDDPHKSEATTQEMLSMINLEYKTEHFYYSVRKRFKLLALLALELNVWEDKMQDLGEKIDANHPQAVDALNFYENAIIEAHEVKEVAA